MQTRCSCGRWCEEGMCEKCGGSDEIIDNSDEYRSVPICPETSITGYLRKYGPSRSTQIARGIVAGGLVRMPVSLVWQVLHDNPQTFALVKGLWELVGNGQSA